MISSKFDEKWNAYIPKDKQKEFYFDVITFAQEYYNMGFRRGEEDNRSRDYNNRTGHDMGQ